MISVTSEDCFAPVPTAKHVIDCPRELDAQQSNHQAKECTPSHLYQYMALTPFLLILSLNERLGA